MPSYRYPPPPVAPRGYGYDPREGDRIIDLIMAGGNNRARAAATSGAIWGDALASAGAGIGNAILQHAEDEKVKEQREAMSRRDSAWLSFVQGGTWQDDPREALAGSLRLWGPERGPVMAQGLLAFRGLSEKGDEEDAKKLGVVLGAAESLSDPVMAQSYPAMRERALPTLRRLGIPEESLPETWTPELRQGMTGLGRVLRGEKAVAVEPYTLRPGEARFGANNQPVASVPASAPEPPTAGSFEDYVTRYATERGRTPQQLSPRDIEDARKRYGQADDRARVTVNTPRPLGQTAEAAIINRLSAQWNTAIKPAVDLDRQIKLMDAGLEAARRGDTAAGAQTILVTFQKILDPTSVVREAEYERSAAGQSLLNRIRGAAERLAKGGTGIPMSELETFADLARQAAKAQTGGYTDAIRKRIGLTADRYNIPRELVFEDFDFNASRLPGPATPGQPGTPTRISNPAEYAALPSGALFVAPDGSMRRKP